MYVAENQLIWSNISLIYCSVFFSHVLGIVQINDNNKFCSKY